MRRCRPPSSSGGQKLGQPVPLSNFVVEENCRGRSRRRRTCRGVFLSSGLLNGRSVAPSRSTANASGVSILRHSASVCVTSKVSPRAAVLQRAASGADASPIAVRLKRCRLVILGLVLYGFSTAWLA